jgi:hypothetical protein
MPVIRFFSRMGEVFVGVERGWAFEWPALAYVQSIDATNSRRITVAKYFGCSAFWGFGIVANDWSSADPRRPHPTVRTRGLVLPHWVVAVAFGLGGSRRCDG